MRRPVLGRRIAGGVAAALLAHLLTVAVMAVAMAVTGGDPLGPGITTLLAGQLVLMVACLATGIVLTVRQDGGFGVGLLIGWGTGLLITPVAGFGACVWAVSQGAG